HVGSELTRLLCDAGATVEVADIDRGRSEAVAAAYGATVVDPAEAAVRDCDVFAPCAMARVIDERTVPRLRCRVVAGAANDTLADDGLVAEVAARGILYVPDFLANAGGVIHIHARREGFSESQLRAAVLEIGDRVAAVIDRATHESTLPLAVARADAREVLEGGLHPIARVG
ncbi:MAG TPA: leucine dehydrogenase, partial [Solirubrobacterales bacterium]|nr:leucine dehydrogenase [Solirubrobacterales bacterium]